MDKAKGVGSRVGGGDGWAEGMEGGNWRQLMLSEISQVVKDKYHMISSLTGT